ncbi:MAG: hypothetical protein EA421_12995 [Gemmatimonadales bacterium]|nr:MAG: hypothetical protein EA421_12995 [Gemmatimonadales bacterium]
MVKGIQLTLMIGPGVPVPVSREVLEALRTVTVTTTTEGPSGFQLTFELSRRSPLHTLFLVAGGAAPPLIRVILAATVGGRTEVLMDGVMTHHEVTGGRTGQAPVLTVTGEDLTRVMDYIDFSGIPYPAAPDFARVLAVLAKYAVFGIVPKVIPSVLLDVPLPMDRIPLHRGKDLGYVKMLAERVGYVFYLEPGPTPGVSTAYWGPELKVGAPQPALNMDMDAHTNVESLDFSYDSEGATLPMALIYLNATRTPLGVPVPAITPLSPPLGAIPPIPKRLEWMEGTGKLNPVQAAAVAMAKAAKSSEVVTATGSLDVLRYGRLLKARKLVGVRGAGTAFDGLYYVRKVTHRLKRGEYKQDFTLSRNGLVSTTATVPP